MKDSGIGRTHSVHGLLEFTNIKNVTVNTTPLKEDVWWYPYSENKYHAMKAAFRTLYCDGMLCRTVGVVDALKSLGIKGKT